MVALFQDMMHQEIEVYVDDMIAKSKTEEEHLVNLRKLLKRLRKYRLRLNPAKCTFGVKSGKLLDFMRKNQSVQWDDDCQLAFKKIKRCLMNPPMLVPLVPRRPLILYMTVLDESMVLDRVAS